MRESSLDLTKAFSTGLLPVLGNNLQGLASCKNARPYGVGMEYVAPRASYLDLTGNYPFPQLIVTDKYQYVTTEVGLYEIEAGVVTLKKTQAATTHYDLADFKEAIVFTGNGHTLFRDSVGVLASAANVPEASTCCSFGGLLLLGNISSWNQSTDVDSATIVWAARPLSAEFRLSVNNIATGAGYIKLNCGDILRIFEAGQKIIVFGKRQIVTLKLISEPTLTLALDKENPPINVNIAYKEAISHDGIGGFVLTDASGFAFAFDSTRGALTKAGFQRFFLGRQSVLTYDSVTQEHLLCNGVETLSLGTYGMGQRDQVITSGGNISETFEVASPLINSVDMSLTIDTQDMGVKGIKTIYASGVDYTTDGKVFVHGSPVNPLGVGTKIIAQDVFQPTITISDLTYAIVNSLELRWKLTDKRNVRGRYDNQTTA